jgi:hypothetical protein
LIVRPALLGGWDGPHFNPLAKFIKWSHFKPSSGAKWNRHSQLSVLEGEREPVFRSEPASGYRKPKVVLNVGSPPFADKGQA